MVDRLHGVARSAKNQLDHTIEQDHQGSGRRISRWLSGVEHGTVRGGHLQEVWDVDHCRADPHSGRYGVCVQELQNSVGLVGRRNKRNALSVVLMICMIVFVGVHRLASQSLLPRF